MRYRGYDITQNKDTFVVEIRSMLGGEVVYSEPKNTIQTTWQLKAIAEYYILVVCRRIKYGPKH